MNENGVPPPSPTHGAVGFVANGEQTTVRVSHIGWLEGERWARAWHVRVWKSVLEYLTAFVERRKLPIDWLAQTAQI